MLKISAIIVIFVKLKIKKINQFKNKCVNRNTIKKEETFGTREFYPGVWYVRGFFEVYVYIVYFLKENLKTIMPYTKKK